MTQENLNKLESELNNIIKNHDNVIDDISKLNQQIRELEDARVEATNNIYNKKQEIGWVKKQQEISLEKTKQDAMKLLNNLIPGIEAKIVKNTDEEDEEEDTESNIEINKMNIKFQPQDYICPIGRELMNDPVMLEDGITYERENIKNWFNTGSNNSPMTGKKINKSIMIPNHKLKSDIAQIKDSFKDDEQLDMIIKLTETQKQHEQKLRELQALSEQEKGKTEYLKIIYEREKRKIDDDIINYGKEKKISIDLSVGNSKSILDLPYDDVHGILLKHKQKLKDEKEEQQQKRLTNKWGYSNNYIKKCVSFYNDYEKYHRYD